MPAAKNCGGDLQASWAEVPRDRARSGQRHRPMIVAVIAVRMVQPSVHQEVESI
jgi:hypothetical protein